MTAMTSPNDRPPTCRACKAPLIWAVTAANGKPIPVDPEPRDDGNLELGRRVPLKGGGSALLATVIDLDQLPLFELETPPRYVSHFATCPDADRFRKANRQPSGAPARQAAPDPDEYRARHTDPDTAHAGAAHAMRAKAGKLDALEAALRARGVAGATADELTEDTGERIRNNVSRAVLSLERQGRAIRTTRRRLSPAGVKVLVYVHPDVATPAEHAAAQEVRA